MKYIFLILFLASCSPAFTSSKFIKEQSLRLNNYESLYTSNLVDKSRDCTLLSATKEDKIKSYDECMKDTVETAWTVSFKVQKIRKHFKELAAFALEENQSKVVEKKDQIVKEMGELK